MLTKDLATFLNVEDWTGISPRSVASALSFIDFVVDPNLGPFLISGTRGLIWVDCILDRPSRRVRVGMCPPHEITPHKILGMIRNRAEESRWGTVCSSLGDAVRHLQLHSYKTVKVLFNGEEPPLPEGAVAQKVDFLHSKELVVVSAEAADVGTVGVALQDPPQIGVIIHDPSRSIAFVDVP